MEAKPSTIRYKSGRVDVLVFGESPGREEFKKGQAFIGPAGKRIRDIIDYEIPKCSVVLDNVCPRWLDGGKPDAKLYREYADYRAKRIKQLKPRVILLLGEHAIKAFGFKGKPTVVCGEIQQWEDTPVVLSIHPSYTLRNPPKVWMFEGVFRSVRNCLKAKPKQKFIEIRSPKLLREFLRKSRDQLTAVDLETSTLDPDTGKVLTCSFSYDDKHPTTAMVPLFHREGPSYAAASVMWRDICDWWSKGPRVVHNCMFELKWLGPDRPKELYDTLLQAWCLDENTPNNLNYQVQHVLNEQPYWLDMPENKCGYGDVPLEILGPYNAEDARCTLKLHKIQEEQMTLKQMSLCDYIFVPLAQVLLGMEQTGIYVDKAKLEKIIEDLGKQAVKLERKAKQTFPGVNFRSAPQMQKLLFEDLKLPVQHKSRKTGKPSADEKALEILSKQEPRLKPLAEARKVRSLESRLKGWLPFIKRNRMHTHFRLGTVVTARLATTDPNVLNVDRKGKQREAMISRFKGGRILQFDYSQHELRCQAAVAGDDKLLAAFAEGRDAHQETADDITGRGTTIDRQTAKNVNFSVIYDITPFGLYEKYGIPKKLGAKLIKLWYKDHPAVLAYHGMLDESLDRHGYVENVFGWRRRFKPPITGKIRRMGYNAPIQSMAVMICYQAMIKVDRYLRENRMRSVLILQVHDSLVIDAYPRELKKLKRDIPEIMTNVPYQSFCIGVFEDEIPLAVDVKEGVHF